MKSNRSRRSLATLVATATATVTMTGGLLMAAPAAHADARCVGEGYVEVDLFAGGYICLTDPVNRVPINRCAVTNIQSGNNWVAAWVGPSLTNLKYTTLKPWQTYWSWMGTFCVGDVAVNP